MLPAPPPPASVLVFSVFTTLTTVGTSLAFAALSAGYVCAFYGLYTGTVMHAHIHVHKLRLSPWQAARLVQGLPERMHAN